MDVLESLESATLAIRSVMDARLADVWTALPVIIAQPSDGHTATMQSAINQQVYGPDGVTLTSTKMSLFGDAPAHFAGGGGVTSTHPITSGDEGMAVFMARAQDLWHSQGGAQDPIDARSHHLSDCRFIPGGRSDPRKLSPAPSTTSQQHRSDDGNHVVDLHPGNGVHAASILKVALTSGASSHFVTPDGIRHLAKLILHNCGMPGSGL